MALSPIPVLIIIVSTLTFEALLFGSELVEKNFPELDEPSEDESDDDNVLDAILNALRAVLHLVQGVFGVIRFFFDLVTFNVPGAPWFVRLIVGSALGGGILWSVATLFRGN